ncbi:Abhydrolase-4 domain-containing protein, partial [Favolaschia claudopus]
VPLDYKNPNASEASIALIRSPASVPRNSTNYRGPILFNPGGPGGSGVDFILQGNPLFRAIIGPEFDLIGFDPRGIARSLPRASFFATQEERVQFPTEISFNASQDAFGRSYANDILRTSLAGARDDGSLRFITTESTARDMLKIVQAHGRDKLQYWGFSYGTVLGATFAAMFPDKVERLIIDGVMDADDYYSTSWKTNLIDTNKTWNTFLDGCVTAGPSACAFHENSTFAIQAKVDLLEQQLLSRPITASTSLSASTPSYRVLDYSTFRQTILDVLYSPYQGFQSLTLALNELSQGNGTAFLQLSNAEGSVTPLFQCLANASIAESSQFELQSVFDGEVSVACNDGSSISTDFDDVRKNFEELCQSSPFCDVWGTRMYCLGWPEYLKNNFTGQCPFNFAGANTSFPLLVISNTADPVTPRADGLKMASQFAGSVHLTQNSPGHCSLVAPSTCTASHVAAYFTNGTLPDPGTICEVDATAQLFPTQTAKDEAAKTNGKRTLVRSAKFVKKTREEQLSETLQNLAHTVPKMFKHRGRYL